MKTKEYYTGIVATGPNKGKEVLGILVHENIFGFGIILTDVGLEYVIPNSLKLIQNDEKSELFIDENGKLTLDDFEVIGFSKTIPV